MKTQVSLLLKKARTEKYISRKPKSGGGWNYRKALDKSNIKIGDLNIKAINLKEKEVKVGGKWYKAATFSGHKLQDRIKFQDMDISIENKKGFYRRGTDDNGKKWKSYMHYPYGYIKMTEGTDGDHVDCYIGDNEKSDKVFVVHQNNPSTGIYDEDKVMLGFDSAGDAKKAFLGQYDNSKFFGNMTEMDMEKFKERVYKTKDSQRKSLKAFLLKKARTKKYISRKKTATGWQYKYATPKKTSQAKQLEKKPVSTIGLITPEKKKETINSPQFKLFFGDWSSGKGSKVLNKAGEPAESYGTVSNDELPLKVYHGGRAKTEFSKNYLGDTTGNKGAFGEGFYFSESKDYAEAYAGKVKDKTVKLKYTLDETKKRFSSILGSIKNHEEYSTFDEIMGDFSEVNDIKNAVFRLNNYERLFKEEIPEKYEDVKNLLEHDGNMIEAYLNIRNPFEVLNFKNKNNEIAKKLSEMNTGDDNRIKEIISGFLAENSVKENIVYKIGSDKFTDILKNNGYDGVLVRDSENKLFEICAFEPNQIKATSSKDFNASSNNIYKAINKVVAIKNKNVEIKRMSLKQLLNKAKIERSHV